MSAEADAHTRALRADAQTRALRADSERFAVAVGLGSLDVAVSGCPGWDLRKLAGHLGWVHRWARAAVLTGNAPVNADFRAPTGAADLAAWIRLGSDELCSALEQIDPGAPTWHPFPVPQVAGVWPRRQAQETMVHRWDAERAVGLESSFDPELAADGVDEFLTVMLPRFLVRGLVTLPEGTGPVRFESTDPPSQWTAEVVGGQLVLDPRDEGTPEIGVVVAGTAQDLLLALWGRIDWRSRLVLSGDDSAADRWLSLGG